MPNHTPAEALEEAKHEQKFWADKLDRTLREVAAQAERLRKDLADGRQHIDAGWLRQPVFDAVDTAARFEAFNHQVRVLEILTESGQ